MSNNMLPRICRECGTTFLGGPRAWYCPSCRAERQKKVYKDFRERKKAGKVIPIGSIIKCEICGKDIIKTGGPQRFCDDCAKIHLKEIDNMQSLDWKRNNPEKYRESKRKFSKKRHAEDSEKRSGFTGVSWDKAKRRWKAAIGLNGIHYSIILTKDKDLAIQARKEAEEMEISTVGQIEYLKQKYKNIDSDKKT